MDGFFIDKLGNACDDAGENAAEIESDEEEEAEENLDIHDLDLFEPLDSVRCAEAKVRKKNDFSLKDTYLVTNYKTISEETEDLSSDVDKILKKSSLKPGLEKQNRVPPEKGKKLLRLERKLLIMNGPEMNEDIDVPGGRQSPLVVPEAAKAGEAVVKLDSLVAHQKSFFVNNLGLFKNKTKKMFVRKPGKQSKKTKGKQWFDMPRTEVTKEVATDLKLLKMRSVLDRKHFYKKNDITNMPKYFQIGKVIESPADFYGSRIPKAQRKKTLVDELLADAEFKQYQKQKFKEIMAENRRKKFKKKDNKNHKTKVKSKTSR